MEENKKPPEQCPVCAGDMQYQYYDAFDSERHIWRCQPCDKTFGIHHRFSRRIIEIKNEE